ncbi:uncharacterized protein [Macrobrachium rosenbergii]|uniref:uncharacterized protein n=1 Tax=Macrobrachium rosenbergii TaxID=79674 RepID=UPI0034D6958C
MIHQLILSLLVTLASGSPRSRGEPLHRTIEARSGGINYQFPTMVPVPLGDSSVARAQAAAFQVDPNTLQASQFPGAFNVPAGRSDNNVPQSQGATFQVDPNTLEASRVVVQANNPQLAFPASPQPQSFPNPQGNAFSSQAVPNPTAFPQPTLNSVPSPQPIQPQATSSNQFANQPTSKPANQLDTQFGGLPGRNNLPGNVPVPGAVEMARRLIGNPPGGALLVGSNPPLFPLEKRLVSNYTKLRPVVTDKFRCNKGIVPNYVGYGYYADVDNECQIFHICLPWKDLYPKQFAEDVTYQFSFICPNQTVFSQDVMTCTWESEALPCEASPELYWLNQNFFRRIPTEFGKKYAAVNDKLVPPLVYDYDDFNPPKPKPSKP